MHVALFGGSFNPPHVGHLLAATYVRAVADVDELWLMPAHRHAFGKQLAPFDDRVALCEALASCLTGVKVTRVEEQVEGEGRTLFTVEHLRRLHPQHRFSLVVGSDILAEAHKWFEFERLVQLAPLIVLGRTGHPPTPEQRAGAMQGSTFLFDVPMPRVSSTEVRERLRTGDSVEHLVPRAVLELVEERGLYR